MHRLHHHYGVVDHNRDRKHEGGEGKEVDREPEDIEEEERTDDGHGNRDHRDDRRPEVLKEYEHDEEHQYESLDKGLHHLMDGCEEEVVGRHGGLEDQACGKVFPDIVHQVLDVLDHRGCVRTG